MNEDLGTDFVGIRLKILQKHIVLGAFHNSAERFDPPKYYRKTREAIAAKIKAWAEERPDAIERLILWIYGPGAVKSAIAQTIAKLCEGLLILLIVDQGPSLIINKLGQ